MIHLKKYKYYKNIFLYKNVFGNYSINRKNRFLNELLESIYNQTIPPKEIIILLDNNNSCKEGAKFINKKNICKIIFCDKLNLSQKRNYGALINQKQIFNFFR